MRIPAFDNLRLASIVLVVVFHAMCAYNERIAWWYVNANEGIHFSTFLREVDNFLMALMFFVSGYFAARTYFRDQIQPDYYSSRFRRLLIPGYLQLWLIAPLVFVMTAGPAGYWLPPWEAYPEVWLTTLTLGIEQVSPASFGFSHHLWFVEVLFVISVICALTASLWRQLLARAAASLSGIMLATLVWLGLGWMLTMVPLGVGIGHGDWYSFTGLLVAQPTRIGTYVAAFGIGIVIARAAQSRPLTPVLLAAAAALLLGWLGGKVCIKVLEWMQWQQLVASARLATDWLTRAFVWVLAAIAIFRLLLNVDVKWLRPWHAWNYGIYLMHMVFVVALQIVLLQVDWPVGWEVLVISLCAFLLSASCTWVKQWVETQPWVRRPLTSTQV